MSMHPPTVPGQLEPSVSTARGLAIASVICGGIGLLFPPLALAALVMGIIALVRITRPGRTGPQGLAITGTVLGGVGMASGCLFLGVLFPALGQARNTARQLKSGAQMHQIVQGMTLYSQANKDWFPPKGADWETLLVQGGYITQDLLASPMAGPGQKSYFYVSPGNIGQVKDLRQLVVLVENPELSRGQGGNVCSADGYIWVLKGAEYWDLVEAIQFDDGTRLRRPQ